MSVAILCRLAGVLALVLMIAGCALQQEPPGLQLIMQVEHLVTEGQEWPDSPAGWQPFTLPLGTRYADPDQAHAVHWFRTRLSRPDGEGLQALYFYRYTKSLDVYFNGVYIGGDRHTDGWDTAAWNHPLLVPIQSANWRDGDNEVVVRLQGSRLGGVFGGIVFGPVAVLQELRDERWFMQVTLNEWLLSFGVLVAGLSLLLWLLRRQEKLYWQFALVSACWMVITYHMVTYQTPLPDRWWLPFVHMAIDGWIYALALFLANWFGIGRPRQFRLHRALVLVAWVWHVLALLPWWWMTAYLLHSVGILFVLSLQVEALRRSERTGQLPLVGVIVAAQLLCYLHDLHALILAPDSTWRTAYHWSQFVFPFLQLIFLAALIRRFVGALTLAESMNQQLENRVALIRAELEQAYRTASAAARQQAAEEERSRIYRDLHDDVGSKLLSIAHAGRDTRLGSLASSALESLRDAVARVNNPAIRFEDFLLELREEMQLRLTSLGIVLGWWQPEELPDWTLSPAQNHHLSRIFRELVNNILRHAGATEVRFDVMPVGGNWRFVLTDNGRGLPGREPDGSGGRGLRARAAELGAGLQWHTGPEGGVEAVLLLPGPGSNAAP